MKLIKDWPKAYRLFSIQALAASAAINGAWLALSPEMVAAFPPHLAQYVSVALAVLGVIGRLVPQPPSK
jgi:hypothetical protein